MRLSEQHPQRIPFRLLTVHPVSQRISDVFLAFAAAPDLGILSEEEHYATAHCSLGTLRFWTANTWYAWGMDGEFRSVDGSGFSWHSEVPSIRAIRIAVRAFRRSMGLDRAPAPQFKKLPAAVAPVVAVPVPAAAPAPAPVVNVSSPIVNLSVPKRALDDLTKRELYALVAMHAALSSVTDTSQWPQPHVTAPAFLAWADALISASQA